MDFTFGTGPACHHLLLELYSQVLLQSCKQRKPGHEALMRLVFCRATSSSPMQSIIYWPYCGRTSARAAALPSRQTGLTQSGPCGPLRPLHRRPCRLRWTRATPSRASRVSCLPYDIVAAGRLSTQVRAVVLLGKALQPQRFTHTPAEAATHAGAVGQVLPYGPQMAEHCILGAQLSPSSKPGSAALSEAEISRLMASIGRLETWLQGCADTAPKGFIYSKAAGGWQALAVQLCLQLLQIWQGRWQALRARQA